jgi:hypothetical protein
MKVAQQKAPLWHGARQEPDMPMAGTRTIRLREAAGARLDRPALGWGPQVPAKQIFARRATARWGLPRGACGRAIKLSDVPGPLGPGLRAQPTKSAFPQCSHLRTSNLVSRMSRWAKTKRPALFRCLTGLVWRLPGPAPGAKTEASNLRGRTLSGFATLHTQHVRQATTLAA